jgi:4-hydroxy-2-oxoheptanedioate aldolase
MSRYRQGLAEGRSVCGVFCALDGFATSHILASAGFDFLIFDRQHAAYSWPDLENLCFRVRSEGASAFIRTASCEEAEVNLALDLPIEGVVLPNVASAAEARVALERTKWAPAGNRSLGNERHDAMWGAYSQPDPLAGLLIEHPGAVEEIDAILELRPDFIWIGTHDLALLLGLDAHEVVDRGIIPAPLEKAIARVTEAAQRHGVVHWGGPDGRARFAGVDARMVRQAALDTLAQARAR